MGVQAISVIVLVFITARYARETPKIAAKTEVLADETTGVAEQTTRLAEETKAMADATVKMAEFSERGYMRGMRPKLDIGGSPSGSFTVRVTAP